MSDAATAKRAASRADRFAVLAAMELMDLGWSREEIAAALSRPMDWLEHAIDREIAVEAAAAPKH